MLADLGFIFPWWLAILGIGLAFFPISSKIFAKFFDRGYLFAKVLGILFSSYLVWLLASFKILPFSQPSVLLVIALGAIANLVVRFRKSLPSFRLSPACLIPVAEELVFFLTLTAWSFVRGFQPNIQGLEKFMDFGFVNSILRSQFFPPADMWFAGKSINYYYFGHFVTAFLTKLTGIDSAITYNLMIATLFAFTFSLTFSLAGNLIYLFKKNLKLIMIGGVISAFLISLGANLHPAYYNFKMEVLKLPYCDGSYSYWYPNATRYIGYCPDVADKTIHEFPSYSFIVSDLHGHVSDIPFVLLFLALCLSLSLGQLLAIGLPMSLTLAVMFMTNQWDFPIYLLVLGLSLLLVHFQSLGFSWKAFGRAVLVGGLIILVAIPFLLPFQLGFEPIVQGIGLVRAHSLPYQLLVLWGAPWFFGLTFLVFLFKARLSAWRQSDFFVLVLFLVASLLIIIPEIIYVKDIYIPSYHRANTMFKLTYQSFLMFSLGIGYIIIRVSSSLKGVLRKLLFAVYFLIFTLLMIYPWYSLKGYYGNLDSQNYQGLYGLKFLKDASPDDYQAVLWFKENVKSQPVVLEAVGDSYTDYERISMATGLPTIEGWLVHEWLWRGSFDEPGKRSTEVQTIYESKDLNLTKTLLEKYKVKYIVVGKMEKEKYPNLNQKKFGSLGKKVFENGQTAVFALP